MYQAEANLIAKRRGSIRRDVLDYELKKKVYSPLAKARALPPIEFAKCQADAALFAKGLIDPCHPYP